MIVDKTKIMSLCGNVPVLGTSLRKIARLYPEGSVTRIRSGNLAGHRWKRSHRYVNGYWLGIYELPIQACLSRELSAGDVFYDIGANAGFFTLLAAMCVGDSGKVFSFEPLKENVNSIRSQLELNNVRNCRIVESAVVEHSGPVEFAEGKDTSTAHVRDSSFHACEGVVVSVAGVSLDDFIKEASPPDFIKMDIEGAELQALQGAKGLLTSEDPPRMLIEFHGDQIRQNGLSMLGEFGYSFSGLDGQTYHVESGERHVLCIPRSR